MTFHVFTGVLLRVGWGLGGGGESTTEKASQERQIKARKLGSIPVLCPPEGFVRPFFQL